MFTAYVCDYCPDRKYAYKQDLTKHLQIHLGDNIYKCKQCDKGFLHHRSLYEHSLEHYKEEQEKIKQLN